MRRSTRTLMACAAVALTVASASACGDDESKEEAAQKQVCDARADIRGEIDAIRALPVQTSSLAEAEKSLESIRGDLKSIGDAQPDLADSRKDEVRTATDAFQAQVETIARTAVRTGATGDAGSAVSTAAQQLGAAFVSALEPVSCPGGSS